MTSIARSGLVMIALAAVAACGDNIALDCEQWQQWGGNPAHDGTTCVQGQPLGRVLADLPYDGFTAQEELDTGGGLIVHYQAPLIEGDDVYMLTKGGTYTPCMVGMNGPECYHPEELYRLNSQVWGEIRYTLDDRGALTERWRFDSDWKPEPQVGFEPMFQPALAGDRIVIPGAGGALWELDRGSGKVVHHVQPFGDAIDPDTYVSGGIAVGVDRTIYYNAIKLDHDHPYEAPAQGWLVVIHPDGSTQQIDYAGLVAGAPAPEALCYGTFDFHTTPLPWPPPPDLTGMPTLPEQLPCGAQRPGINTTPAVAADGTVFLVSRAHFNEHYGYLIALDARLAVKWATSLADLLHDGCGVTVPADATATDHLDHCAVGAALGVDPTTNLQPAARVDDASSSSPVALPDGGVLYGAVTLYNGYRGHLVKLGPGGQLAATYDFGWDTTPSVVAAGTDYRIVLKDNHYGVDEHDVDLGPYYITELDSSLHVIWKFLSTETRSCVRTAGGIECVEDHPHGFEWCINAPVVDDNGVTYANSEDGNVYAITADGQLRDKLFLEQAVGAAYTPLALDHRGRIFALNNGHMVVVGGP